MLLNSAAAWEHVDAWLILIFPLAGAALGGVVSWLSQRMLFGPLPMLGSGHGILARRAETVADRLGDSLGQHIRLAELFRRMEPEKIAGHVSQMVTDRLEEHVDAIMRERHAVLWDNLPQLVRERVYSRVQRQLPSIFDNLLEDMAEHVDDLVDVRQLIGGLVPARRELLAQVLADALRAECRFLLRAAIWTGLGLGLLQAVAWAYLPSYWLLPALTAGIAAGALLLPQALLFRKTGEGADSGRRHDAQLSDVLAQWLAVDLLSPGYLMQMMLSGPRATRSRTMIRRYMRPLLETGLVRTSIQLMLGAQAYAHIKQLVVDRVTTLTVEALTDPGFDWQQGAGVVAACQGRVGAMPPAEVESLVQSVFDEGLWERVAAVVVFGLGVGLVQALLLHLVGS